VNKQEKTSWLQANYTGAGIKINIMNIWNAISLPLPLHLHISGRNMGEQSPSTRNTPA